jgi:hypothetical protein
MSTKDGELVRPSRLAYGRSYTTRTLQYSPPTLELAIVELNRTGFSDHHTGLCCSPRDHTGRRSRGFNPTVYQRGVRRNMRSRIQQWLLRQLAESLVLPFVVHLHVG